MDEKNEKKEFKEQVEDFINDVKDDTSSFNKSEIDSGRTMGVLGYIIPFVPYFAEKKNKFVRYHAKQGMNLLVIWIAYFIIRNILTSVIKVNKLIGYGALEYRVTPWWVVAPFNLIALLLMAAFILGVINACNGKAKELPVIGKLKIFK